MNFTNLPINYSTINSQYYGTLAGKSDVWIIAQNVQLFHIVAWYWILLIFFLLVVNPRVQEHYSQKYPGITKRLDLLTYALNAGFLLFLLGIVAVGRFG